MTSWNGCWLKQNVVTWSIRVLQEDSPVAFGIPIQLLLIQMEVPLY